MTITHDTQLLYQFWYSGGRCPKMIIYRLPVRFTY